METRENNRYIRWFQDIQLDDVPLVGGKNASLGELHRALSTRGIAVPPGFAVTAEGFRLFMEENDLFQRAGSLLERLDTQEVEALRAAGREIRHAILDGVLPEQLSREIVEAYARLGGDVAVRSSATAEDLPDASFAGQQETYLNVQGPTALLEACRRCYASLFTDRAISYRADRGYDPLKAALSIGIQSMVRADLGAAGVMFTLDTETGFKDVVLINASYGLGENVVQGSVNPDEYMVFKPTLRTGHRPILRRMMGSKEFKLVYDEGGGRMVKNVPVPVADRERFVLDDDDILELARWAVAIEDHYSGRKGAPCPMDIEWAKDGRNGRLFIVQARPETVQSRRLVEVLECHRLQRRGRELLTGRSVGDKIAVGPVRVVQNAKQMHMVQSGDVLVTDRTDPDWEPAMRKAAAIVTNRGGRTCHAAIVSRELGLPAIVGTERGTEVLTEGQMVTVSCAEGDTGRVYEGSLPFEVERIDLSGLARPRTRIMMNVGNPDEALALSLMPSDGVGLAREEFIITSSIKVHPMALLDFARIEDDGLRREIEQLTRGYADKPRFFVDRLAQGVAMIAAAFHPRDVILRLSDFKSNEYANLIGGRLFEPVEENPMIGFRGASRYYDPRYRRAFALECQAVMKVRGEMGLENLKLMVPFCRTVEEGEKVLAEMAGHGLVRGEKGLEVYVMCEIPSNVILAGEFAKLFDGFSIGSNDLTQLVLGVDRDSAIVAHLFDERNRAVKELIAKVIEVARERGRKVGICGQAPSDYPEFACFLVEQGIESLSLNPDAVLRVTRDVLAFERDLDSGKRCRPEQAKCSCPVEMW